MAALLHKLKDRGLIHDCSHAEELEKLLESESVTFYCGFDPTADSLHVGSMLPLLIMRQLQKAGHKPIVVLGAATGMIGDPSGKSEERNLLADEQIEQNLAGMKKQCELFFSSKGENAFEMVRNDEWLSRMSYIEFLRDVGKHFSVNMMMAKESVKTRLENREQGISYTEFSYMLLQAYDFLWLYENKGCRLQVGGSDQWGNITAGTELIRRKCGAERSPAYALTFPLLTTASGAKFGKTEKGAVWLDPARTSPYEFYQYWLNTADEDVISYVKLFTEIDGEELAALESAVAQRPEERAAQKQLAETLTTFIHGTDEVTKAEQASKVLFGEKIENIDGETLISIFSDVPSTSLASTEFKEGMPLIDLLVKTELAKSKGAARRAVDGGGIYINNAKVSDNAALVSVGKFIDNKALVLRSGKKNYHLVLLED